MRASFGYRFFIACAILILPGYTYAQSIESAEIVDRLEGTGKFKPITAIYSNPTIKHNYNNFPHVEHCVSTVHRAVDSVFWGARRDTLPYNPDDTLPSAIREAAHICTQKYNVADIPDISVSSYAWLAVYSGKDSIFLSVLDRLIMLSRSEKKKEESLSLDRRVFYAITAGNPLRLDLARLLIRRWNELRPDEYNPMYALLGAIGKILLNPDLIEEQDSYGLQQGTRRYEAAKKFVDSMRNSGLWDEKQVLIAAASSEYQHAMHKLDIGQTAKAIRYGPDSTVANELEKLQVVGQATQMEEPRRWTGRHLTGLIAPEINPPFKYFINESKYPVHGKPAVVIVAGENCGTTCAHIIRRIRKTISSIPVVLISQVSGVFRGVALAEHAVNAERQRAYFLDSLGLEIDLAVDTAPIYVTPGQDKKYVKGKSNLLRSYTLEPLGFVYRPGNRSLSEAQMILVNSSGVVVWEERITPLNEKFLVHLVHKLQESAGLLE